MRRLTLLGASLAAMLGAIAFSCGGSGSSVAPLPAGQGRLAVDLVDAPNRDVKEIWVTINKVTAHSNSAGWTTVMTGKLTLDLLKLKTYSQPLGFTNLPPGKITQIRLYVDEGGPQHVVLPDGTQVALKVPSGVQSGIKIHGPFEISACSTTLVTLDFDGKKSIWVHPTGQGELWILRPVIHTKRSSVSGTPCTLPDGGTSGGGGGGGGGEIPEGGPGNPGNGNPGGHGNPGGGNGHGKPGGGNADGGGGSGGSPDGGGINEGNPGTGPGVPPGTIGTGFPCTANVECLSNLCVNNLCGEGGPGSPCRVATDCASKTCQADGTCAVGPAKGTGATCAANTECLSGSCVNGICDEGNQGAPCKGPTDCAEGYSCELNVCVPQIN